MGKFKRKYPSSSSENSSSNFSNFCSNSSGGTRNSQIFSSSGGNSGASSLSGLSRHFGDKRFKLFATPQSSSNSDSQPSRLITEFYSQTKANSQSNKQEGENSNGKLVHHSTPKQNFSSDTLFDDLNYSEILKEHFSQLTEELIGEACSDNDKDKDNVNRKTSENDDLDYSGFSFTKQTKHKSPEYEFTTNLNEHFSELSTENMNPEEISENEESSKDINLHYASLAFDDALKTSKSSNVPHVKNSDNSQIENKETKSESNVFALNNIDSQTDQNTEYSENTSNFEDFLRNISFNSSDKIRKIETEFFELDQKVISNIPILQVNHAEKLNNSFTSEETLSTGSKQNFNDSDKRLRVGLNRISKDRSLIYTGSNLMLDLNLRNQKRELIKNKIEGVLHWYFDCITEKRPLVFKVRNNTKWDNCIFQNDVLTLKPRQQCQYTEIRYSFCCSRARFTITLYLFIKNYLLLQTNSIATQREIYYQIKNLVSSQYQIRVGMNTISSILNIEPWYFPIIPTSKGLVFGDLSVVISEEEILHCNAFGGTLIPQDVTKIREFRSNASFILVVEKDAIFKKLLDEDITNKLTRPFIIVTGKGFPDINTRLFVKKLWMSLRIPVFILVDADPDGIDIMLTYRFGSLTLAHVSEQLAIPHMRWLGVLPSEINELKITHETLNDRERNKTKEMLKRPYVRENPWLKRELEVLIKNDFKAEIEGIIKSKSFLTDVYLPSKFYSRHYF